MRHGLSDCNIKFRMDHSNFGLNKEGIQEVKDKKKIVNSLGITKVFSSPIPRARETAQILFPSLDIEIVEGITECTGPIWLDIANNQDTEIKQKYLNRVKESLQLIEQILLEKNGLIVAHGGNFWAVSQYFGFDFILLKTSEIVKIVEINGKWKVEGIPNVYNESKDT